MSTAFKQALHRVLVIDDDIDWLMLLERRLMKEGYVVETAASLPEAEEIISFFSPHLILLDININGNDGRQLCWKLKHTPATEALKVLLMSGYDCSITRATLFGADGILAKPISFEYLLHCLQQQLASSSGQATSAS
jgi:DNA-binding response OmpR family regulator